jgi:hypothetical protein
MEAEDYSKMMVILTVTTMKTSNLTEEYIHFYGVMVPE